MQQEKLNQFDQWAIMEVFGHQTFSGKVTSETVGNTVMLKLTVPEVENMEVKLPEFIKYFNQSSVYAITPVDEDYARAMAKELMKQPIEGYKHQSVVKQMAKKMVQEIKLSEVKKLMEQQIEGGEDEEWGS